MEGVSGWQTTMLTDSGATEKGTEVGEAGMT